MKIMRRRREHLPGAPLAALLLLLALPACSGNNPPPAADEAPATDAGEEEPGAENRETEPDPGPALASFQAFQALPADASIEEKEQALFSGYRAHLQRAACLERDIIVETEGVSDMEELRRLVEEIMKKKNKGRKKDGEGVVIGEGFLKAFKKEADEKAQALFGVDRDDLKEMEDDEIFRLWLRKRWTEDVVPSVEGGFFAGDRVFADRAILFFEGGKVRRRAFVMIMEAGAFRYAGTWKEREAYVTGPERLALFSWKSDKERREASDMDLSMLQEGLMEFKRHMERYPTGVEGLDALLENPGGRDGPKWLGPYAHHLYDPWGRRFRLKTPGKHNPDFYDVWSAGPDGTDGTEDDITNY